MRRKEQTSTCRQLFSYEGKLPEDHVSSGSLLSFSEITLSPRASHSLNIQLGTSALIVPLVGGLFTKNGKTETTTFSGEMSQEILSCLIKFFSSLKAFNYVVEYGDCLPERFFTGMSLLVSWSEPS